MTETKPRVITGSLSRTLYYQITIDGVDPTPKVEIYTTSTIQDYTPPPALIEPDQIDNLIRGFEEMKQFINQYQKHFN